jgi:plastocyanin
MKKHIPSILGIVIILIIFGPILLYLLGKIASVSPGAKWPPKANQAEIQEKQEGQSVQKSQIAKEESKEEEIKKPIPETLIQDLKKEGEVVIISDEGFDKTEVALREGKSISFLNADSKTHKVFGKNSQYFADGVEIDPLSAITLPLEEKGTFEFSSDIQPEKTVKIKVE